VNSKEACSVVNAITASLNGYKNKIAWDMVESQWTCVYNAALLIEVPKAELYEEDKLKNNDVNISVLKSPNGTPQEPGTRLLFTSWCKVLRYNKTASLFE
jgi:hypothetical protein